ncbi:transcriptional regulator [Solibacillus sp. FSL R5-0691]|uniref:transcriptional regulator n=1 Tax=Solibacillus sp. FSL R5-0691 TaxID=2921653 RepID=UPI0030CAA648
MIKSSKSIATKNVNERFEKVSTDLFYYLQLGLIKPLDFVLYIKYLELYNEKYGYAFPTIPQLRDYLNCGRSSILEANKRLVEVGLIKVDKHKNNNNIYLPMQPLSKSELTSQVPTKVRELEMRQAEISKATENDRMRFGGLLLKQSNKISD